MQNNSSLSLQSHAPLVFRNPILIKNFEYTECLPKRAKAVFLSQEKEKSRFKHSKAILLISMAQIASDKEKFAATIELVNKSFAACDVSVCDSLQRHTIQINDTSSPKEIRLKSLAMGEEWIARNRQSLDLLAIPNKIFRWDEYILDPGFNSHKEKIITAYQEDETFKDAMDYTIKEFLGRYGSRESIIDSSKAFNCCFNYLAEECAIMMLMWQKFQYNYIIYPSTILKVVEASRNKFVVPLNPELLKWLRVRVRTRADASVN